MGKAFEEEMKEMDCLTIGEYLDNEENRGYLLRKDCTLGDIEKAVHLSCVMNGDWFVTRRYYRRETLDKYLAGEKPLDIAGKGGE